MLDVLPATLPATSSSPFTEPSMSRQALMSRNSRPATISAATRPMISARVQASSLLTGDHRHSRAGHPCRSQPPALRGRSLAHRHFAQGACGAQDPYAGVVDASDAGERVRLLADDVD